MVSILCAGHGSSKRPATANNTTDLPNRTTTPRPAEEAGWKRPSPQAWHGLVQAGNNELALPFCASHASTLNSSEDCIMSSSVGSSRLPLLFLTVPLLLPYHFRAWPMMLLSAPPTRPTLSSWPITRCIRSLLSSRSKQLG